VVSDPGLEWAEQGERLLAGKVERWAAVEGKAAAKAR